MTAYIVTDLAYGDSGKGTTVDLLARQGSAVVARHSGGPQAGHNVLTPDGRSHTFSQFGSGTFAGAKTYLSKRMLINPLNMELEAAHLIELGETDIWQRTFVDREAIIITPYHVAVNRLQERTRGAQRHGSCGQGVGVAVWQNMRRPDVTIRVKDIGTPDLVAKLTLQRLYLTVTAGASHLEGPEWQILIDETATTEQLAEQYLRWANNVGIIDTGAMRFMVDSHENLIFEGAQGVLLDEGFGFHPHTTWSTTTHQNALDLLDEIRYDGPIVKMGLTRAYMTRHGAGPFVTEDVTRNFPEPHNSTGPWQGVFRQGHLDLSALRYAVDVCDGIDQLVVTHLDRSDTWLYNDSYILNRGQRGDVEHQSRLTAQLEATVPDYVGPIPTDDLLAVLADTLGAPIGIASRGPTADDKEILVTNDHS